jgi:hypothetical protein
MSKNKRNTPTQPPIYVMPPPQQPQNDTSIFNGLGGFALSALVGLLLGQFGIGLPKLPKL